MQVDIDTNEIAGEMVAIGAHASSFSHEFWEVMRDLYPEFMDEVYAKVCVMGDIASKEKGLNHAG